MPTRKQLEEAIQEQLKRIQRSASALGSQDYDRRIALKTANELATLQEKLKAAKDEEQYNNALQVALSRLVAL